MKKSAMLPAGVFLLLLAGCAPYYAGPPRVYEPTPPVVSVPVLPPEVILEDQPYYSFRGYFYYWNPDLSIWLYSGTRRGPWYRLPRSHYPGRFRYRGRWYEGDRDRDRDRERERGRDRDYR